MTDDESLANENQHEFPDNETIKTHSESFYAKIDYYTPEGRKWVVGWTVPGTIPGTDIPTLDVFWTEDDQRRKQIVEVEDISEIEVREVDDGE